MGLINGLILEDQFEEDDGLPEDSEFIGVPIVYTHGFKEKFGDDYLLIGGKALELLIEKYPLRNWKYLQVYFYGGIEFWCTSDAFQGKRVGNEHITFLIPDEN